MLVTDTIATTLTKLGGPRHAETTRSGDIPELVKAPPVILDPTSSRHA